MSGFSSKQRWKERINDIAALIHNGERVLRHLTCGIMFASLLKHTTRYFASVASGTQDCVWHPGRACHGRTNIVIINFRVDNYGRVFVCLSMVSGCNLLTERYFARVLESAADNTSELNALNNFENNETNNLYITFPTYQAIKQIFFAYVELWHVGFCVALTARETHVKSEREH